MKTTKLVTIHNYAKRINVSPSYVYRLIKDKKLKSEKIDGVMFVKL